MNSYIIAFGIFLAVIGIANLIKIQVRSSWKNAEAKILESKVEGEKVEKGQVLGKVFVTEKNMHRTIYHPAFSYEYTVDGEKYYSSSIYSAPLWLTMPSDILPFVWGSNVQVKYDGLNPSKSYLSRSSRIPSLALIVMGFVLVLWQAGVLDQLLNKYG